MVACCHMLLQCLLTDLIIGNSPALYSVLLICFSHPRISRSGASDFVGEISVNSKLRHLLFGSRIVVNSGCP
ncbi:hypothetical protein OIU79_029844 [Salix purpurea]|uniref:Secreted protein n=1 Tax=Salix purpurea TaxID=77065 RepID=A0A9Q0VHM9_SALPP|nr:hypothetical protein OIU79_029844 [Salix purpurea]